MGPEIKSPAYAATLDVRVNPNPVAAISTAMTMLTSDKLCQYQYSLQATPSVVPM